MRILFITSDYKTPDKGSNIYTDLASTLHKKGHHIKVVVAEEKKNTKTTYLNEENEIPVLRVKTGNLYEVGLIEKGLTFLTVAKDLKKGIKKYFNEEKFDLILFQSPPLTMQSTVRWAMKKYHAKSYLMMKDIFPQNGLDIGLYTKVNPMYLYFKIQEKKLYKTASKIGCMSQGNIDYLLDHNNFLEKDKLELFPNTAIIKNANQSKQEKKYIREKYGLKEDDVVAIFGGNFGKPQGLDFMLEVINKYQKNKQLKFVLIGKGTEKQKIYEIIKKKNIKNVLTFDYIPREEYEKLTRASDIGLIFLDHRFTIPNYPSKTLSYFESSLPIMAATDANTDYKDMIVEEKCGFWALSGDIKDYTKKFDKLIESESLRKQMGKNGRKYYEENCNVDKSVKILEQYMEDVNNV